MTGRTGDPWASAPRRNVRARRKQKERVDHEAVLGPEPLLRDIADGDDHAEDEYPVPRFFGNMAFQSGNTI